MMSTQLQGDGARGQFAADAPQTALHAPGFMAQGKAFDDAKKPTVVGLYGLSGSGKTYLLNQLGQELQQEPFHFFDGSEIIASLVPGGLEKFKKAKRDDKIHWRELAIREIRRQCAESGRIGVVAGHFVLWSEDQNLNGEQVWTQADTDTYTHIFYLNTPVRMLAQRRGGDNTRLRQLVSEHDLARWQSAERQGLRDVCHTHGIIFGLVPSCPMELGGMEMLLRNICQRTEWDHLSAIKREMDQAVAGQGPLETMLVLDADRTLAAVDTGMLFWPKCPKFLSPLGEGKAHPLKSLFGGPLGYSSEAFLQAELLYEETGDETEFDQLCSSVAAEVTIHPEFVSLLQAVVRHETAGAVVLTCGLQLVWEKVLEHVGLSKTVPVVGNGRVGHNHVVTPSTKAAAVTHLKDGHQMYVWAFGDSPLDLLMMREANQAVVVVGEEKDRSSTMDAALADAIQQHGMKACQALLPATAKPRLNQTMLPAIQLDDQEFIARVLSERVARQPERNTGKLRILHATDRTAAKLFMTPMRDASVFVPALRRAHHDVGRYLAIEVLADAIGTEEYSIPHVQGHQVSGFRLKDEEHTIIVALMRGGEPMAFGVNEAFPRAMFLHSSSPGDIKSPHLTAKKTVILVDSVVNSGKTAAEFVQHIRMLRADVGIFIVAGVVQRDIAQPGNQVGEALVHAGDVTLIALRLSENKFTGRGSTDTGNRLFNTTQLA